MHILKSHIQIVDPNCDLYRKSDPDCIFKSQFATMFTRFIQNNVLSTKNIFSLDYDGIDMRKKNYENY